MKTKLLFLISCLFLFNSAVFAQINLQDSLLVHFTTDATDQSGRGNHGTLTSPGVYLTANRTGLENEAMFFNGAFEQGMISLPVGFIDTMSAITMSGWIKPQVFVSGGQGIFGQDNVLEVTAYSGPNRLRVFHPVSGTVDVNLTAGANVWYHIAVTADTLGMKIYVNGQESASRTGNYKLSSSLFSTNLGGKIISQSSNYYSGTIEDFRIYNRVINTDEISFLAGAMALTYSINTLPKTILCTKEEINVSYSVIGENIPITNKFHLQLSDPTGSFDKPTVIGSTTGNSNGSILAKIPQNLPLGSGYKMRLVGTQPSYIGTTSTQTFTINNPSESVSTLSRGKVLELLFDGNTTDNSTKQRNGTAVGGVSYVDDRHGNPLKAVKLNGTNGHIVLPEDVWFDGSAFSVSVWVNPESYNNWSRIFDFSNGANNNNVNFSLSEHSTGKIHLGWRQGTSEVAKFSGEKKATLNTWNHVAAVYDGTTAFIYVNGELSAQSTVPGPRYIHRTLAYIGRSPWTADAYANAAYDDFILWDRALTTEEIRLLAHDGNIITNSPVCAGSTLHVEAPNIEGASYSWTGPDNFTSSQRINYIANASDVHMGKYIVTITLGECSYVDSISTIQVVSPGAQTVTSFTGLPQYSHPEANIATLTGSPTGGYFTGNGITENKWNPATAGVGTHDIYYHFFNTTQACNTTNKQTLTVHPESVIDLGEEISCSGFFYDSGGNAANYGNNETIIKTFTSASGEMLEFTFTNRNISANDTLYAFDGPSVNDRILVAYTSGSRWEGFTSSGPSVTFKFVSNDSGTNTGWTAQYSCTSTAQESKNYLISNSIVSVCNGRFFDDGGPTGNHGDVGSYSQTFYSRNGNRLKFSFTEFRTHGNSDVMRVYDGPNTSYPLLTTRANFHGPFSVESNSDVLTITFSMFQNGLVSSGWAADISCTEPPMPAFTLQDTTITICNAIIYDHAGPAANYDANRNDTMVLKSGSNQLLQLRFNHSETGIGSGDTLFVFDGTSVNNPVIAKFINGSRLDDIISSGDALTLVFKSDDTSQGKGFMATLSCLDAPPPVVNINLSKGERGLCSGIVRDPGGTGNYSVGTNTTQVFRSLDGNRLLMEFSELAINGNNDGHWLYAYDGPNSTYPLIGRYNQWAWPPNGKVESTGEYMTLNFNSTNTMAGGGAGFTAEFSCTTPPLDVIPMTKGTFSVCDVVISDNGGITAGYAANSNDTTTLCSANGQLMQVIFNHNETGLAAGDTLWIFDGPDANSPQLGKYFTGSRLDNIVSTGTCLTFVFSSDDAAQGKGWQGIVSCIASPPAPTTYIMSSGERNVCQGTFYDNGGSTHNYSRGTWTQTFTSYSEQRIRATRTSFSVNGNNDGHWLSVYDGPSTASPKIGDYNNFTAVPEVFQSSGTSLTFHFNSTNTLAGVGAGFSFDLSCFSNEPFDVDWIDSPVCAGSEIEIPFTINDAVNDGNIFHAQLSDANGSFTSPVNIGSLTGTAAGTISATIPAGTAGGNNYRVRIVSTNPAMIGLESPNPVVIYALPNVPVISTTDELEICDGIGNVTLTTALQTGVNYRWIRNGSQTVGANQNTFTTSEAGEYSVEVSNTCSTLASSNSQTVVVTSPALAHSISAQSSTDICDNQDVTLWVPANSPATYQWYLNGTDEIGTNDTIITVSAPGTYSVNFTNVCGTVAASNTIEVTQKGIAPHAPEIINTGDLIFCEGGSVLLSIAEQTGVTYQWHRNDTIEVGTDSNEYTATETGIYTVTVFNDCGTEISINEKSVEVFKLPMVPVISHTGSLSLCKGDSVKLEVTAQDNVTYHWKLGIEDIGSDMPVLTVFEAGTYSIDIENICGTVTSSNAIDVLVNELPEIPMISSDGSTDICPGSSVVLNTTVGVNESILWFRNNQPLSGEVNASFIADQAGEYTVQATNENLCSSMSLIETVSFLPAPESVISGSAISFCPGLESITLTANEDPSASIQWYGNDILLSESGNQLQVSETGSYKAVLSYTNGCSTTSNIIELLEGQTPEAIIISTETSVCSGESLAIIAKEVDRGLYTWYKDESVVQGPSANHIFHTQLAGTYKVVVQNEQGCEAESAETIIEVLPVPEATLQASATSFCQVAGDIMLTANVVEGATYEWFRDDVSLGSPTAGNSEYMVSLAGTYKVRITTTCSAESNSIIINESVLPSDAGSIEGFTSYCAGTVTAFSIPVVANASGYLWEVIPETGATIAGGQGTNTVTLAIRNQNITLKVTPFNDCGTGKESTRSITIDNSLFCTGFNILFSAFPSNTSVGTPIIFTNHTNTNVYPDATPRWNFGEGASPATANGNGPHTVTYSSAGSKNITIDYISTFGGLVIATETKPGYVTIIGAPVATSDIQGNITLQDCSGTETYSVINTPGSVYNWKLPAGATFIGGQGTHQITIRFNGSGGILRVTETNAASVNGAEKSLTITCSGTVSVDDPVGSDGHWSIYPNPTSQYVYLDSEKLTEKSLIHVYTLCGKSILISDYTLDGKQAKIDLEGLPFGVYLLQVKTDSEIRTFRIIKD
jgi:hypothetical protein